MNLIEDIGPILGVVAFLGFAVLALLIVLQAREVRRLREWAGRAPERAGDADAAAGAAADKAGTDDRAAEPAGPSWFADLREQAAAAVGPRWEELDRRSPIHPSWFVAGLAVAVLAGGVVTGGFGVFGGGDGNGEGMSGGGGGGQPDREPKVEVAVLNATQQEGIADPVPGIAGFVAAEVVRSKSFRPGTEADALSGEEDSVILFEPEAQAAAEELAAAVQGDLGPTAVEPMTVSARDQADGAPLVLLVGFDDAGVIGAAATDPTATP